MSASYLSAVAVRLVDACSIRHHDRSRLSADEAFSVLLQLPMVSRLRAAAVCKDFLEASRRPGLYANCGKDLLSRRAPAGVLEQCALRLLGAQTLVLNLANMRSVDDAMMAKILLHHGQAYHDGRQHIRTTAEHIRMPNLHTLDLSACEIGDDSLGYLSECCKHGMPLRCIYLWAAEDVSDVGVRLLAGHCHQLQVADLRMCGSVTGKGVRVLAESCHDLRDLRLKGLNKVLDTTISAVGASCPCLTSIDLSSSVRPGKATGACITDAGISALGAGCPRLEHVVLSGLKRVGNAGVVALAAACPSLRLLDLQGCSTVSDEAALALAAHCPLLHTVSFQCCARLSDCGFVEICTRCPLRHVTLKLCAVTRQAVDAMRAEHPSLHVAMFEEK